MTSDMSTLISSLLEKFNKITESSDDGEELLLISKGATEIHAIEQTSYEYSSMCNSINDINVNLGIIRNELNNIVADVTRNTLKINELDSQLKKLTNELSNK